MIRIKDVVLLNRVLPGVEFTEILKLRLPFKIPIWGASTVGLFPSVFQNGDSEYGVCVDSWLQHFLLSWTSEQAVVIADSGWQGVLKAVASVSLMLDEHDASSLKGLRPDFSAFYQGMLVMKGEAKSSLADMMETFGELTSKFHPTAYKLFPKGCSSIPAVATCNEQVHLYALSYLNEKYSMTCVRVYNVVDLAGRVDFIVDIFKLVVWILSQIEPIERFHLVPDVRRRTLNGHHVTFLRAGIYKEFHRSKLSKINMEAIRSVYAFKLDNVETGTANGKTITITRVGARLKDALRDGRVNPGRAYDDICRGVTQLHARGYAHCDICVDNIFFDEDSSCAFLGDLEYCRPKTESPPCGLRRGHADARTAEELDNIQLIALKDEIASI